MNRTLARFVRGALDRAGYRLERRHPVKQWRPEFPQASISPLATYSPWETDRDFRAAYDQIRNNTVVDHLRCYELWELCRRTEKLGHADLIEVGVWRGGTGALLAMQAREDETVFLCDTFRGVVKAGPKDTEFSGGEFADTSPAELKAFLDRFGVCPRTRILEGVFPEETAHEVTGRKFRLAHIDVDVRDSARDATIQIWDSLIPGGVVVYDDYGFSGGEGVTDFVNEFASQPDAMLIYNLNGHAIVLKWGSPRQS